MVSSSTTYNPFKNWSISHVAEQLWPIPVGAHRIYGRTTPEKINGVYLLGKIIQLIIIFNLHTYEKDEFKSKPKTYFLVAPMPTLWLWLSIVTFHL